MKQNLLIILSVVILILLIPLIAMQFTDEVNWALSDFLIGGALLFGLGLIIDYMLRRLSKSKYKVAIIITILFLFTLLWMELAVGLFGSPIAGN